MDSCRLGLLSFESFDVHGLSPCSFLELQGALVEFAMARDVQCLARGDGDRLVAARSGRFLFCAVVHFEERRCDGSSVTSGPGVLTCMQ